MKSYLSAKINWLCSIMFTGGNNVEKMTRSCLLQWENVFLALVIVSPYIYQYIVLFFFFLILLIYFIAQDTFYLYEIQKTLIYLNYSVL